MNSYLLIFIGVAITLALGYLLGIFFHGGWPRRAMQSMLLIDELREHEGATVEIACDNPEPETRQDQVWVSVTDDWTDWQPRRFDGETVLDCLQKAKFQRDCSATIETVMREQGKVRLEQCSICGEMVSDWIDPDWAHGRVCRHCETLHENRS